MNRVPALLPVLSLAIAACSTENVALFGSDKQPDGSLLLQGNAAFRLEAVMQLDTPQTFRFRFNGQYGVVSLGTGGPYDYLKVEVREWIAGTAGYAQVPPGTYVVEMVDASGTSWGQSPPIAAQSRNATIIFVHLDGQAATWVIDPATQDADPATMETTVSNLSGEDVTVRRCQVSSSIDSVGSEQACTALGSAAAGADFHTVETISTNTMATLVPALLVGSYQRLLVGSTPAECQLERIVVMGMRTLPSGADTRFAMSACNGF